MVDLIKVS